MKKNDSDYKAIETMCILAIVSILFGLFLKIHVFIYIALAFLIIGTFIKKLANKISDLWLALSHILGMINSKIILSVIFFLFLTPLAFFYRLFHGDFMDIKKNSARKTCYKSRDHLYSPKDLENVW